MLHLHAELHGVWNRLHVLHDVHCLQYANSSSFFVSWCVVFAPEYFFSEKQRPWTALPHKSQKFVYPFSSHIHAYPKMCAPNWYYLLVAYFRQRGCAWRLMEQPIIHNMHRSWVIICIIKVKRWITSQGGVSSRQIDRSRAHPFSCC